MSRTIVVIPCYNEARRLDVAGFEGFLEASADTQLLLANDGSTDGTLDVLQALHRRHPGQVRVLDFPRNAGKAEAVRQGLLEAFRLRPKYVGYWDADLATPLDAIDTFRQILDANEDLQLVMGSRVRLLGRRVRRGRKRHLMGRVFATAASAVLGLAVYDTQCGAKMFRVSPQVELLFERPFRSRWIFDVEILARWIGRWDPSCGRCIEEAIYELPLERWHDVAGSKIKFRDCLKAIWELAVIWKDKRRLEPAGEQATVHAPTTHSTPRQRAA